MYGEGTVALFSQRDVVGTHGEEGADALDVAAGQGEVEGGVLVGVAGVYVGGEEFYFG